MGVEEAIEFSFQGSDLASCGPVLLDEGEQPAESVAASQGGGLIGVEMFEAAEV